MIADSRAEDTLPDLLSVPELADYLSVPVSTVYYWRARGEGPPGFRVGKQLRFRATDVARWLEQKGGEASEIPPAA